MSREIVTTFDCGYQVRYPITREPDRRARHAYELSAEMQHNERCQICKEEETAYESGTSA